MAGIHQKVDQSYSSNAKEKVKYMVWTNEMDHCLAKILAEQVKNGNKVDNILKPAAYAAALKVLNEKFSIDLSKDHIKNRLKTWKKQFGVLKELLAHRGFEWDEAQKMVIADNSVWNDYIQAHPDARMFRVKFIENYDELCIILGKDQAMASYSDNGTEINLDLTVDKRDLDCVVVSELQTDGNQTKNLRWTDEMDHWLGKILVDQMRTGNKVDNMLHAEAYGTAVSTLNAKFGRRLTKDHIKNRLKTWKKQYKQIKELLSHAGFKWDETLKMIVANDSTWSDYIKIHPDARTFQSRVFENFDQLCTIFGHPNELVHCNEPAEVVNLCPSDSLHCDSNAKDQGKQIRWTNEMDRCLSDTLVQLIKLGHKSKVDNKIKPSAYEAAALAVNERFQLDLTKDHVRNRLKTWKKQYDILKELLDQDGFEWDDKRKMVLANDSVWNEYIKINPDARLLKGRVIQNYNELCIIIGGSYPLDSSSNGAGRNMGEELMDAQEASYLGRDTSKEKGKSLAWTDEMDRCLTDLLVEQVMLGNRLEKNFKSSAYIAAVTVLNEKFGLDLTKENIKNRLKTWKKQYNLVKEMISHGRFEWDERLKMVVGNDSEWNEYIKKHPEARHLQARHIENYNELGMIVGNEQASGRWSETCERLGINPTSIHEEHAAETPARVSANEEMSHGNASEEMQGSSEQTRVRPSSSHSKQPSKRRRTSDAMLEMMSAMAADIGRIADALTENKKTVCLDKVFEIVQNIPGFDDDLIVEACEYLCSDDKRALMFMKLDERLRSKWLLKRLRR
ncbi:hypothetical protein L6164_029222 [Bauhinia variegata]|uniref:Uncharacterized protein n=1 Tax=Bauhinia variegata TaxID=167791 RepID=A0ACB9L808_BAUVA|nr:hypothetical protein L6164_029222 [Bauhinia variegata]